MIAHAALAIVPLLAAWTLRTGKRGRWIAATLDAAALFAVAIFWTLPDADWSGLFFSASILVAVLFAVLSPEEDLDAQARLHLGASLGIVAAASDNLAWSVPAVLLSALLVQETRKRLHFFLVPLLAALVGLVPSVGNAAIPIGLLGLAATWLVAIREVLRNSPASLVNRTAISFVLLVGFVSVALRFPAGLALHAVALGCLGLGALGALGATRVTTFLASMTLARAGLVLFAQLGGTPGRAPAMMALAVSGAALLLLAAALEDTESVEDGSTLGSVSRRLVLVLGALSLGSFPPFPGFYILFPLSSAVFERGYSNALIAAALLLFLVALGCLRLVSRAVDSHGARSNEVGIARAALVLSLVAILAFSIVPAPLAEIARIAALARN